MKITLLLGIFCCLLACNSQLKTTDKNNTSSSLKKNIQSIDLRLIEKDFAKTILVEVKEDPVYHTQKRYNVVLLNDILNKYFKLNGLNKADYKMVFECEDGYKPEMPLEKLMQANAYLAVSDADAPKGEKWLEIQKDGHIMNAAPFYIVYKGVSPNDGSYKWPYNLVKMHFEPLQSDLALTFPADKNAKKGYELYKLHCQTCHAVNGVGGQMGPELNYPKNITEYWKEDDLIAFIKNPSSYRKGVKMPTLNVSELEVREIVVYLKVMKEQKISF